VQAVKELNRQRPQKPRIIEMVDVEHYGDLCDLITTPSVGTNNRVFVVDNVATAASLSPFLKWFKSSDRPKKMASCCVIVLDEDLYVPLLNGVGGLTKFTMSMPSTTIMRDIVTSRFPDMTKSAIQCLVGVVDNMSDLGQRMIELENRFGVDGEITIKGASACITECALGDIAVHNTTIWQAIKSVLGDSKGIPAKKTRAYMQRTMDAHGAERVLDFASNCSAHNIKNMYDAEEMVDNLADCDLLKYCGGKEGSGETYLAAMLHLSVATCDTFSPRPWIVQPPKAVHLTKSFTQTQELRQFCRVQSGQSSSFMDIIERVDLEKRMAGTILKWSPYSSRDWHGSFSSMKAAKLGDEMARRHVGTFNMAEKPNEEKKHKTRAKVTGMMKKRKRASTDKTKKKNKKKKTTTKKSRKVTKKKKTTPPLQTASKQLTIDSWTLCYPSK
jgi:hypothetical protein